MQGSGAQLETGTRNIRVRNAGTQNVRVRNTGTWNVRVTKLQNLARRGQERRKPAGSRVWNKRTQTTGSPEPLEEASRYLEPAEANAITGNTRKLLARTGMRHVCGPWKNEENSSERPCK